MTDLLPDLHTRLAQILDALRAAAGPGVPILGMTYHVPFLGFWGLVPGGVISRGSTSEPSRR